MIFLHFTVILRTIFHFAFIITDYENTPALHNKHQHMAKKHNNQLGLLVGKK